MKSFYSNFQTTFSKSNIQEIPRNYCNILAPEIAKIDCNREHTAGNNSLILQSELLEENPGLQDGLMNPSQN